ncbi:MAG: GntR family transcriptional regulator [Chloroflexota bacterium]|nr:GntR family transcriptional regulator [Chloroflexota bacterium]
MNSYPNEHLNRHNPTPLYQQLAEIITKRIEAGQYKQNDKLPSENELMETYGISRHVIRQTLNTLRQQGLIHTEHGMGSFVCERHVDKALDVLQSYHKSMEQSGFHVSVEIVDMGLVPTPEFVRIEMHIDVDEIFLLQRIGYQNGNPLNILQSYLLPGTWGNDILLKFKGGSLYQYLEENCDLKLVRSSNIIEVCFAKDYESQMLDISRGTVLMQISSISYDRSDQPVEYSRVIYPGASFRFKFESRLVENVEHQEEKEMVYGN